MTRKTSLKISNFRASNQCGRVSLGRSLLTRRDGGADNGVINNDENDHKKIGNDRKKNFSPACVPSQSGLSARLSKRAAGVDVAGLALRLKIDFALGREKAFLRRLEGALNGLLKNVFKEIKQEMESPPSAFAAVQLRRDRSRG